MKKKTLVALAALVAAVALAPAASAAPTQTFQLSYAGLNSGTYWEWWLTGAQKCTENQPIYGAQPAAPGKYPVVVYLHGTYADWSGDNDGKLFVQQAAAQGFLAVAVQYDSAWTLNVAGDTGHAFCIFDQTHAGNPLTQVCALAAADCTHGISVVGFSQGAVIAMGARNFNPNITAAWAMGTGGSQNDIQQLEAPPLGNRALPNNKLLITVGQDDTSNLPSGPPSGLPALTGDNCGAAFNCVQPDGSGYYVVSNAEVSDGDADHCFFEVGGCFAVTTFDPGFAPPATTPWSIITNLNWLRAQLRP